MAQDPRNEARPSRRRSNAGPDRRPRRRKIIETDPKVRVGPVRSWRDRVRMDARTGLPGLVGSLGLHAVLLVILAIVAVQVTRDRDENALLLSWLTADPTREVEPRRSVSLDAFQVESQETQPKSEPEPEDQPPQLPVTASEAVEPVDVKNLLQGRESNQRRSLMIAAGGDEKTQQCMEAGLLWLKRQQRPSGNWQLHTGYPDAGYNSLRTDTGATALALMVLLGAGNTQDTGDHKESVRKGLEWLIRQQKDNGDLHDHNELGRQTAFYAHSQATIAICEALALTGDESLRRPAEKAVQFLIRSQQPVRGGWKYQPQDENSVGDLSVTGWALMALHTGRVAGLSFSREPFQKSSLFLDSVQERNGAVYKYEPGDAADSVTPAMTASGLLCRQYLGWPRRHPSMIVGVDYLLKADRKPQWSLGRRNLYEWYYVGHVLHNLGGTPWKNWYGQVQSLIVENQTRSGSSRGESDVRGSWHPTEPPGATLEYADKAGRLYLTCMCLLVIELPFRHLPIYESTD